MKKKNKNNLSLLGFSISFRLCLPLPSATPGPKKVPFNQFSIPLSLLTELDSFTDADYARTKLTGTFGSLITCYRAVIKRIQEFRLQKRLPAGSKSEENENESEEDINPSPEIRKNVLIKYSVPGLNLNTVKEEFAAFKTATSLPVTESELVALHVDQQQK